MFIPSSTYRIQLNDSFTLRDLSSIVPYLHDLGISTIYASPITTATKGSRHGYDVTDAVEMNPEIGTEEELKDLTDLLHSRDMSWLQDIVPNHMAYDPANPWLYDVLERGRDSMYHEFFDIIACGADDRLMAPFLGCSAAECLEKGELTLQFTPTGFVIRYFAKDYPVAARLYGWICGTDEAQLEKAMKSDPATWAAAKSEWLKKAATDPVKREAIAERVTSINGQAHLLEYLVQNQHYSLTDHRLAAEHINYRRFFTINGLICLSMEKMEVFQAWHRTLLRWFGSGWIDGLRVDHIDGLAAPGEYLQRLRRLFGQECYVVAEKILTGQELLPGNWPLEGTTGYDFLAAASQLLTEAGGSRLLLDFYRSNIIDLSDYKKVAYERKLDFLCKHMGGELLYLMELLTHIPSQPVAPTNFGRLKEALAVWMASFPVYRVYPGEQGISPSDRSIFIDSMAGAKERRPDLLPELDRLAACLDYDDSDTGRRRFYFLRRLMQFTGPLAAKGIEDTTFYVYDPFIAHCEVGDSPGVAGITAEEFHRRMCERQSRWPHTLNATTTHDTKRGEDARIRLSFLSCIPRQWTDAVTGWRGLNREHLIQVGGRTAPSPNDEYMIYQSLLGGFPEDGVVTEEFRERFAGWLLKALREAKTETNYDTPDEAYEGHCRHFASTLLRPGSAFLSSFTPFARDVIRRSATYSLSQLLLKLTAPGVPDIYQGSDLWELSFVDPDNRRPVDFAHRSYLLAQIRTAETKGTAAVAELLARYRDNGIEKLFTLYKVLHCRRQQLLLFADGAYIPVACEGPALAYCRRYQNDWALVAVPLLPAPDDVVRPATIALPSGAPTSWTDAFTGASVRTKSDVPCWPEGLANWPVALLTGSTGRE